MAGGSPEENLQPSVQMAPLGPSGPLAVVWVDQNLLSSSWVSRRTTRTGLRPPHLQSGRRRTEPPRVPTCPSCTNSSTCPSCPTCSTWPTCLTCPTCSTWPTCSTYLPILSVLLVKPVLSISVLPVLPVLERLHWEDVTSVRSAPLAALPWSHLPVSPPSLSNDVVLFVQEIR